MREEASPDGLVDLRGQQEAHVEKCVKLIMDVKSGARVNKADCASALSEELRGP